MLQSRIAVQSSFGRCDPNTAPTAPILTAPSTLVMLPKMSVVPAGVATTALWLDGRLTAGLAASFTSN